MYFFWCFSRCLKVFNSLDIALSYSIIINGFLKFYSVSKRWDNSFLFVLPRSSVRPLHCDWSVRQFQCVLLRVLIVCIFLFFDVEFVFWKIRRVANRVDNMYVLDVNCKFFWFIGSRSDLYWIDDEYRYCWIMIKLWFWDFFEMSC